MQKSGPRVTWVTRGASAAGRDSLCYQQSVSFPAHAPDLARPQARLLTAAERLQDRRLRARVVKLFDASTEAIGLLADLELIPLGEPDSGAPQSLAAWEELAPVMGQTVSSVNQLLAVAQQTFPSPPEQDVLDSVDCVLPGPKGNLEAFVRARASEKQSPRD